MTPKQIKIYEMIKRFGKDKGITAAEVGNIGGYPRNRSEKWAKPALRELVKAKKVRRDGDFYILIEEQNNDSTK